MTIRSKDDIVTNITNDLADNNAGLISAADVRNNMIDIVESINQIVGSGNFDGETPFRANNVKAQINEDSGTAVGGLFIAESGVRFPNGGNTGAWQGNIQLEAYPGAGQIDHNALANKSAGNPHTQYMHINGENKATENMPLGDVWVNSSGYIDPTLNTDDRGLSFEYTDTSVSGEIIHVGSKSTVKFDLDNSYTKSGKSFAQAWVRFEGTSGNVYVNSSYNVDSIVHTDNGHYQIFFTPNTFSDASYLAVGMSNSIAGSGSAEDFDVNTVGIVERDKDYLMFLVKSDDNEYVNAAINDLVVFGNASGVIPSDSPTITNLPT
jgi:hypothetical protein